MGKTIKYSNFFSKEEIRTLKLLKKRNKNNQKNKEFDEDFF